MFKAKTEYFLIFYGLLKAKSKSQMINIEQYFTHFICHNEKKVGKTSSKTASERLRLIPGSPRLIAD